MNHTTGLCQEGPFGTIHIDGNVNGVPWSCAVHNLHNSTQNLCKNSTGRKCALLTNWKREAGVLLLIKSFLILDGNVKNSTKF